VSDRIYPHNGTCDVCSVGTVPVRTEDYAYVCATCDELHDRAVDVAAREMGVDFVTASRGVDAYLTSVSEGDNR
jgi:hypothetical protein